MRPCLMTAVLAAFCATSAAATAIETKLDCADRKGWTIAAETVTEAEGRDVVTIRMSSPVDTFGRPVATGRVPSGLARVEVPASGYLRLSRDE